MTLFALSQIDSALIGPVVNVGAIGVCLVVLAIYFVKKDKKYDARMEERVLAEAAFRKEQAERENAFRMELTALAEKYRAAMEKFGQTLDAVIRVLNKRDREEL
jgi:hypothetical protein